MPRADREPGARLFSRTLAADWARSWRLGGTLLWWGRGNGAPRSRAGGHQNALIHAGLGPDGTDRLARSPTAVWACCPIRIVPVHLLDAAVQLLRMLFFDHQAARLLRSQWLHQPPGPRRAPR